MRTRTRSAATRLAVRMVPAALFLATLLPGRAGSAALVAALVAGTAVVVRLGVLARKGRVSVLEPLLALAGVLAGLLAALVGGVHGGLVAGPLDRGLAVAAAVLMAAALARSPEMPGSPVPGHQTQPGR